MSQSERFPLSILSFLSESFIGAFGITRPSSKQARLVSIVLGGILLLAGIIAVGVVGFMLWELHAGRR